MPEEGREISAMNVTMSCSGKCEKCEQFFECKNPIKWEMYNRRRMGQAKEVMKGIKWKVATTGGKGGVGKTLVSVNFAAALAMRGYKVTLLDLDFDGACVPKMLGVQDKRMKMGEKGMVPVEALLGIQVISTGNILASHELLTWYSEMRRNAIEEFLADVDYGERDFLIIDLPPGTSSEAPNLMQYIPDLNGIIGVTMPSEVTANVARKALLLAKKAGIPVLGIVENLRGFVCPDCGTHSNPISFGWGEKLAKELNTPFLAGIPMDPIITDDSDKGVPFVYSHPESPASKTIVAMTDRILKDLGAEKILA